MGDDGTEPTNLTASDDSDDEDEDYLPGADPDAPADDDDAAVAAAPAALSVARRRAVDAAFLDLFGYPFAPAAREATTGTCASRDAAPARGPRAAAKRSVLAAIFGARSAARLAARAAFVAKTAGPRPAGGGMLRLERRVVADVKRFAGQEIRVERVVLVPVMAGDVAAGCAAPPPSGTETAAAAAPKAKGVDDLLSEMDRPEKLSTMSKTSADWDLFKAKNSDAALTEQLESQAQGNAAYLVKKDFLTRVDARRFELEKAKREQARAKRGK